MTSRYRKWDQVRLSSLPSVVPRVVPASASSPAPSSLPAASPLSGVLSQAELERELVRMMGDLAQHTSLLTRMLCWALFDPRRYCSSTFGGPKKPERQRRQGRAASKDATEGADMAEWKLRRGARRYSVRERQEALMLVNRLGVRRAARALGIPVPTLYLWRRNTRTASGGEGGD